VCPTLKDVSLDDVEVKKEAVVNYTNTVAGINAMTLRYSSWTKLQRTITWLLRFKSYCRKRYLKHNVEIATTDITAAEVGKQNGQFYNMCSKIISHKKFDNVESGISRRVHQSGRQATRYQRRSLPVIPDHPS